MRVVNSTYKNPDRKYGKAVVAAVLLIGLAACSAPAKVTDHGPYDTATGRGDGWGGNPPGL